MRPSLEQAIAAVQQLPNLPSTTRVVLGYLNDDDADINQVVQAIARDQGLVARVLRIANSPFYGLPNQVQTIHEAVIVLGFSNLRLVVTAAMMTAQKFPGLANGVEVQRLFRHSIAVAICAAAIGRSNKLNPNLLFLTGILHDIGKLALMATFTAQYEEVQSLRASGNLLTIDAEAQVFGFNHATIGAALCRHWHLPEAIAVAIGDHHSFGGDDDLDPSAKDYSAFAEVIHLADAVALGLNLEADPLAAVPPLSERGWIRRMGSHEKLNIDFKEIERLYQELVVLIDGHS
ncbi:HDOD domain-containing protein [Rhodoferax saidenbachensis]|uniref:Nucleotidyltransferase with HDIG domain n=1 Tax=Rhodoferax saidenbachensis TaxID=1484693 RepID=A0ABU1ZHP0_9BURK|nr:HDOD domain-containing protein [Rhodoferax saidenbachensis]MDR7305060.1 putative nucleotidyltransferase with HDIG domain [Rhodoferax saidenbachensis]